MYWGNSTSRLIPIVSFAQLSMSSLLYEYL